MITGFNLNIFLVLSSLLEQGAKSDDRTKKIFSLTIVPLYYEGAIGLTQ